MDSNKKKLTEYTQAATLKINLLPQLLGLTLLSRLIDPHSYALWPAVFKSLIHLSRLYVYSWHIISVHLNAVPQSVVHLAYAAGRSFVCIQEFLSFEWTSNGPKILIIISRYFIFFSSFLWFHKAMAAAFCVFFCFASLKFKAIILHVRALREQLGSENKLENEMVKN